MMTLKNPGQAIPEGSTACRTCGGSGWLYGGVCTRCEGDGVDQERPEWTTVTNDPALRDKPNVEWMGKGSRTETYHKMARFLEKRGVDPADLYSPTSRLSRGEEIHEFVHMSDEDLLRYARLLEATQEAAEPGMDQASMNVEHQEAVEEIERRKLQFETQARTGGWQEPAQCTLCGHGHYAGEGNRDPGHAPGYTKCPVCDCKGQDPKTLDEWNEKSEEPTHNVQRGESWVDEAMRMQYRPGDPKPNWLPKGGSVVHDPSFFDDEGNPGHLGDRAQATCPWCGDPTTPRESQEHYDRHSRESQWDHRPGDSRFGAAQESDRLGGTCDAHMFPLAGDTPCSRSPVVGWKGEPTPDHPEGHPIRLCRQHADELKSLGLFPGRSSKVAHQPPDRTIQTAQPGELCYSCGFSTSEKLGAIRTFIDPTDLNAKIYAHESCFRNHREALREVKPPRPAPGVDVAGAPSGVVVNVYGG